MSEQDPPSNQQILAVLSDVSELSTFFDQIFVAQYLRHKKESVRVEAMNVIQEVFVPFLFQSNGSDESNVTLLNDVLLELFEKLKDLYCVYPSLQTINQILDAILKSQSLASTMLTSDFCTSLLTSTTSPALHVPSYNFKTREAVYKVYETITLNKGLIAHIDPVIFMSCVLSSVEGESDPRNLLVVFELLHFMLLNFCQAETTRDDGTNAQIDQLVEDIYDKLSCYYPINFKPPKDDKFKITPELLQTSINNCMLATEHKVFIDNLLPFIIEKMS